MMNTTRFALGGFSHNKDNELLSNASTILQAMESNPYFPNPTPTLADLQLLYDDFKIKLATALKKGNPEETVAKNNSRQLLITDLRQLSFYVTKTAESNLQALLSSGFELSRANRQVNFPEVVRDIQLREGRQSGQIRLDFAKQSNVLIYEYRYAMEAEAGQELVWLDPPLMTTSSRNNILAPLIPFTRYYVQVRAINGAGKSDWSEPMSYIGR